MMLKLLVAIYCKATKQYYTKKRLNYQPKIVVKNGSQSKFYDLIVTVCDSKTKVDKSLIKAFYIQAQIIPIHENQSVSGQTCNFKITFI